ncbi:hypothetical protein BKA69DRAFT_1058022 [Paraphysoderma sedebokerense]|nr:hypothetical protein BKA69DRAFT_1058022 [Paraphysoderma sedebokerense]
MADSMELDVHAFLSSLKQKTQAEGKSQLVDFFNKFEELYDKKLWHQLTLAIESFLAHPQSGPYLIPLYKNFVKDFESKLNQLRLVAGLGVLGARQTGDPQASINFLDALAEKCKPAEPKKDEKTTPDQTSQEAYILCIMESSHYHLLLGHFETVLKNIKKCEVLLDSLAGVDNRVSATFYRVGADYYKAKSDYGEYYKTALLFLGCIPDLENDLSREEKVQRAHDLALAALLSDSIYNFGELLMHKVLDSLVGTPHEWLRQLLFAFNAGDIGKFEGLGGQFSKQPLLMQNMGFLRQKICLMSLIEAVFKRKPHDRTIQFAEIARETRLPVDEVEHLVMKALSLKLIKGSIDQVDGTVVISWVQPRVLDQNQVGGMMTLLEGWLDRVKQTSGEMEGMGGDLFITA